MRACAWDSVVSRPFAAYFLGVACVAVASLIAVEVREGLPSSSFAATMNRLADSLPPRRYDGKMKRVGTDVGRIHTDPNHEHLDWSKADHGCRP